MNEIELAKYWYYRHIDNFSEENIKKDQKLDWQINKLEMYLKDSPFNVKNGLCIKDKVLLRLQASFYYGADLADFEDYIKDLETGEFKLIWDKKPDGLSYEEYFKEPEGKSHDNKRLIAALGRLRPFDKNMFYSLVESNGRRRKKGRVGEYYFNRKLRGIHLVKNKNLEIVHIPPSLKRFAKLYASCHLHANLQNDREILEELELLLKKLEPSRVNKFENFLISISINFEKAKETDFIAEIPERCAFVQQGDSWEIVYEYSKSVGIRNTLGMHYIHFLLQNNNRQFSILSLVRNLNDYGQVSRSVYDTMDKENLKTEHLYIEDDDIINLTNPKGLIMLEKRLKFLGKERNNAKENKDPIQIEQIDKEVNQIESHINSTFKSVHILRNDKSNIDRQIKRVRKIINTALRNIKENNEELFKHLKYSIRMGQYFCYSSDRDMNWKL